MRLVSCSGRKVLYELGEPIEHVYFPESAVISLLQMMNDGTSLAIAAIGYEGMLGLPVFFRGEGAGREGRCTNRRSRLLHVC